MTAFLFYCNQKGEKKEGKNGFQSSTRLKIEVRRIGEVRTRKSYAGIQFIEDRKERKAYLEKQHESNPTVAYLADSISKYLVLQFEKLGLIKNGELLLQNLKKQTNEKTTYSDNSGRKIRLIFYNSQLSGHCHFQLSFGSDLVDIDTRATTLQDLDYAFLDIIPGGNIELVFLDDYYIMNGDNFDFKVYEIKIR